MTNKEIVQKIIEDYRNYSGCGYDSLVAENIRIGAEQTANRKDQQFKEYLEEKAKNNVPPGRTKDDLNLYSPSYFEGRDDVIREIINELFGQKKYE